MPPSDSSNFESDAALRRLAYLAGLLLIIVPFLQALSQIWPLQFTNIQWRFQAANALSSVLVLPFCGLALVVGAARISAQTIILRVIGVLSVLMTLGLVASLIVFSLDALQLKTIVTTKAMPQFVGAASRVGIATVIFVGAFAMLSLVALKKVSSASIAQRKGSKKADDNVGLIVGQGAAGTD